MTTQQPQVDNDGDHHHQQQDTPSEEEPPAPPRPTKFEVESCQFSHWYPTFRSIPKSSIQNATNYKLRKNVTIESNIIKPLPNEFIEYLLSDGVRLPRCAARVSSCMKDDTADTNGDDGWNDSDDNDDESSNEEVKQYNFPNLTSQIQIALENLGGNCMPKLNWSSPKDATWMNCGTLKCTKVGDVYLLLKSSEFVSFDLERAWDDLEPAITAEGEAVENDQGNDDGKPPKDFEYELVLRKWCNLHPSMEFRCFIYNHELIAISQRHPTKFYSHLQLSDEDEVHPTTEIIHAFFETYVQRRFASGNMHRYVMDVYVDSQERTWVVDFNVWGSRTDALLFDWVELMEIGERVRDIEKDIGENGGEEVDAEIPMPELRVVTKDMKDLTYDPLSSFRGPTDVMNLMGAGNNDDGGFEPSSFKNFMEQCVPPSEM
ncbi:cell division cycle 123 family protein [Skeletonema marinoi]|uniref:Cell division cycle 123 family protein n=1 Tax=Skeletonema marinoi TaxID=267567 RepID=A0AAD8YFC5_9STRA|nr:cell division cycle 123 family protein [Skeletonema marinoi]